MNNVITRALVDDAMSYASFRNRINSLLIERQTTGKDQDPRLVEYTRLNTKRMDRFEKQVELLPELLDELKALKKNQIWLGIAEAWCGDVPANVTALAKLSVAVPTVSLRLVLRDEHPDLMDAYLTNGSRSIPKIIALDAETLEEQWVWGPRPEPAQKLFDELRIKGEDLFAIAEQIQKWYNQDRAVTLQQEVLKKVKLQSAEAGSVSS
ncbi:thioredoxin family protein [Balneolaceae bacterium ANBcel3]|nr:thioredoxin family protein [Balneolaceae bacterium ANBcel3]